MAPLKTSDSLLVVVLETISTERFRAHENPLLNQIKQSHIAFLSDYFSRCNLTLIDRSLSSIKAFPAICPAERQERLAGREQAAVDDSSQALLLWFKQLSNYCATLYNTLVERYGVAYTTARNISAPLFLESMQKIFETYDLSSKGTVQLSVSRKTTKRVTQKMEEVFGYIGDLVGAVWLDHAAKPHFGKEDKIPEYARLFAQFILATKKHVGDELHAALLAESSIPQSAAGNPQPTAAHYMIVRKHLAAIENRMFSKFPAEMKPPPRLMDWMLMVTVTAQYACHILDQTKDERVVQHFFPALTLV